MAYAPSGTGSSRDGSDYDSYGYGGPGRLGVPGSSGMSPMGVPAPPASHRSASIGATGSSGRRALGSDGGALGGSSTPLGSPPGRIPHVRSVSATGVLREGLGPDGMGGRLGEKDVTRMGDFPSLRESTGGALGVADPSFAGPYAPGLASAEFTINNEHFPALPGSATAPVDMPAGGVPRSSGPGPSAEAAPAVGGGGGGSVSDDVYLMKGLVPLMSGPDQDLATLALGMDLTTLGLNLAASEPLYTTFSSPWAEGSSARQPLFTIPTCYNMAQTPKLKTGHLHKFVVETLFYIFYAMPRDILQAYAAQELYARDWRYHQDLRLWFHTPSETPAGSPPQYVYFDINAWDRRRYTVPSNAIPGGLEAGFLSHEDVAVRLASGPPGTPVKM